MLETWNPACRRKRSGLEFGEMKAAEALQAPVRGAEVWPLSVEAYHALGEARLIPERTELLYGFVYHKRCEFGWFWGAKSKSRFTASRASVNSSSARFTAPAHG